MTITNRQYEQNSFAKSSAYVALNFMKAAKAFAPCLRHSVLSPGPQ